MYRILAPRGTPLKTTERPYFLISGFGMLLTAALTVVVLIPVHYAALNSASLGIPRPAWDPTGSAAVSSLLIIRKQSVYLKAVYDRGFGRLFWAILISNCLSMFLTLIFAARLLVVFDRVL
jgi:hypothetical protein